MRSLASLGIAKQVGAIALSALLALAATAPVPPGLRAAPPSSPDEDDPRFFSQTGLHIDDERFWDFFQHRGGVRTFGYPLSTPFQLLGARVQVFQRHVLQLRPDGSVGVLNLLSDFLPYAEINGSVLPPVDATYLSDAPRATDGVAALAFVRERVPDIWEGEEVSFLSAFFGTVRYEDAFADASGDADLLPGFALELWGLPTSAPARDPRNASFVYQRFQKGMMHYDATTGRTEGLLLADQLKALLTGLNLPPDLETAAATSPLYRQFNAAAPLGLSRPEQLPATNLLGAFPSPASAIAASHSADGEATTPLPTRTPTFAPGSSTCQGDELMTFAPGAPVLGNELLIAVTSAKTHQYVRLTGLLNPTFLREREGQRGWVWEWTTTLSFPGRHDFTFYVDSTVVCTANYVVVSPAPGAVTATPTAVASATLTPTPTATSTSAPTATSQPTSTPSATPQTASALRSTASVSLTAQKGDMARSIALTVTLLDASGQAVPNRLVRVTSSRPSADAFTPGADQWTNSQGQVLYTVTSCAAAPAVSTYTAEDRSDGVTLNDRPTVTWTTGSACP